MALHETSHALDHSKHNDKDSESHGEKWEKIFKTLLIKAAELGYLDRDKIKFDINLFKNKINTFH